MKMFFFQSQVTVPGSLLCNYNPSNSPDPFLRIVNYFEEVYYQSFLIWPMVDESHQWLSVAVMK